MTSSADIKGSSNSALAEIAGTYCKPARAKSYTIPPSGWSVAMAMQGSPLSIYHVLAVILVAVSAHPSLTDEDLYTAAVVEFRPNISLDILHILTPQQALEVMMYNLHSFDRYVQEGKKNGADIIVFPEDGIYGFVIPSREAMYPFLEEIPDPRLEIYTPCGDARFSDRPVLTYLSCLAQKNEIVLVANMGDKQKCNNSLSIVPTTSINSVTNSQCPPNGWYQYNTNVAFDSDGSLLAKYHKTHLYNDENKIFDTPHPTPHVTFNTSFGVTFGTFTCYDILYCDPPLELLNMGVRNFIFPTAWGNSYPFYTSVAIQQAWSWRTGSNFLAANQHFPSKTSFPIDIRFYLTGSGIYSSGSALSYYIDGDNFPPATGIVLVSQVVKNPPPITATGLREEGVGDNQPKSWNKQMSQRWVETAKWNRWSQHGPDSDVSGVDMINNTYLNFTALGNQPSGIVTVSYTNPELSLNLQCTLEYTRQQYVPSETYALGVYIGGSVDNPKLQFGVCSLVKCPSSKLETCGAPVDGYVAETVFEKIKLSGDFAEGSTVLPVVLLNGLELVSPSSVELGENSLIMEGVGKPLLSANIWSRVYPTTMGYTCQNT